MTTALQPHADPLPPTTHKRIAVVIPAYRVRDRILAVLSGIGPGVDAIYVIDDACPEHTGQLVQERCDDPRVKVITRETNGGVGAAVKTGYAAAMDDQSEIIVKLDGDGQMDPSLIPRLIRPLEHGTADYTKGNRFFNPEGLRGMPRRRLLGNAVLSFMTKLSTGYWQIFDPTNGFTAIQAAVLRWVPLQKVADGYFFESDLLFRLGTIRAVVIDVPMEAVYASEHSSLSIRRIVWPFMLGHMRSMAKRITYGYFLRSFSIATIELVLGVPTLLFGIVYGIIAWARSSETGVVATSGQVMIAALPIIVGFQLLLSFLQFDIASTPEQPIIQTLDQDLGWTDKSRSQRQE